MDVFYGVTKARRVLAVEAQRATKVLHGGIEKMPWLIGNGGV